MFKNQLLDVPQVMRPHAAITRQTDAWIEPELTLAIRRADVDVRWLVALIGIKMKPERSDSQDCRHGAKYTSSR